jgi:hypothetical protein
MNLALTSADGFVIAMITILAASFGVVFLILLSIVRHGGRRDREVERLIDEVEREARPPQPPRQPAGDSPAAESPEPWEKEPDWWKR